MVSHETSPARVSFRLYKVAAVGGRAITEALRRVTACMLACLSCKLTIYEMVTEQSDPKRKLQSRSAAGTDASFKDASGQKPQGWWISVPSTFRHSRMNAASAVQPLAETIVPST